jgi:quinol monooxygenase YgiN
VIAEFVNPKGHIAMSEVQLIARHTMKPGTEASVLRLVGRLVQAARTEPGNLAFDAYRSIEDPSRYVLLERYKSREALAAHRSAPHFKNIVLEQLVPLLAERTIEEIEITEEQA